MRRRLLEMSTPYEGDSGRISVLRENFMNVLKTEGVPKKLSLLENAALIGSGDFRTVKSLTLRKHIPVGSDGIERDVTIYSHPRIFEGDAIRIIVKASEGGLDTGYQIGATLQDTFVVGIEGVGEQTHRGIILDDEFADLERLCLSLSVAA